MLLFLFTAQGVRFLQFHPSVFSTLSFSQVQQHSFTVPLYLLLYFCAYLHPSCQTHWFITSIFSYHKESTSISSDVPFYLSVLSCLPPFASLHSLPYLFFSLNWSCASVSPTHPSTSLSPPFLFTLPHLWDASIFHMRGLVGPAGDRFWPT